VATGALLRLSVGFAMLVGSNAGFTWLAAELQRLGISPSATAAMLLVNSVAATVGAPFWSDIADRTATRAYWLPRLVGASALVAVLFLWLNDAWAFGVALGLFGMFRGGCGPLIDATTVNLLGANRDRYAIVRAMGSIGFLLLAVPAGWLHDQYPRGGLALIAVALGLGTFSLFGLPETGSQAAARTRWRDLVLHPRLGPVSLMCVLHGWTLTTFDQFFSLLVEQRGLPGTVTGQALVVAVAVEIGVMFSAPWLLRRFTPRQLLLVAVASGAPRWWFTSAALTAGPLIALQGLHGLTFAAFWLAGVALVASLAPDGRETSAQSLFMIATYGVGRMLSMGTASLAFLVLDVDVWFRLLAGVSVVATAVCVWALREAPELA
jgi:PPP family 3-phenylpropionic acid transporter